MGVETTARPPAAGPGAGRTDGEGADDADARGSNRTPARRRPRGGGVADRFLGPLLTVLLSLAAMAQALRVWEWRPGTPLGLTGDGPWMAALVQGYLEYGPYSPNPRFGAPFALNTGWSSTGNDLHVWALTVLGWLGADAFTALALYFFLSFPLAALTMYWLCRHYGTSRPAAVVAGVLFSVLPGHQERFPHLFLAAYWAVPFAAWVVIESACGRSVLEWATRATGSPRRRRVLVVLALLAVGLGDVYYVAFTLALAVPLLLLRQVRRFDVRELGRLAVPLGVLTAPALVSLAVARRRADADELVGGLPWGRTFLDSDRWAGRVIDLVLPWSGHRVDSLALRTRAYDALTGAEGETSALGIVALLGVVGLFVVVGAGLLGHRQTPPRPLLVAMAAATLLATAFFTRGGLGSIFGFLVTPQIRTWSRLFLLIALLGLLAAALLLTRLAAARGRRLATVAAGLVLVVGVLDQTNPDRAPDYAAESARLTTLRTFGEATAGTLGRGCSVFVLPVVGFPEVNDDTWYDLMALGLGSDRLRYSFGAIKGTAVADWQIGLPAEAGPLADDLAAVGYCGVVVERSLAGRAPTLASGLRTELGAPVATSGDGQFSAYDLSPRRARLLAADGADGVARRADAALHPVIATLDGVWALDEAAGRRYPLGPGPGISLANLSDQPRRVRLDLTILGPAAGAYRAAVEGPGGSTTVAVGPRERADVSLTVTVAPGRSGVQLRSEAPVDWEALADRAALPSVLSVRVTALDAVTNVGVDLPTP